MTLEVLLACLLFLAPSQATGAAPNTDPLQVTSSPASASSASLSTPPATPGAPPPVPGAPPPLRCDLRVTGFRRPAALLWDDARDEVLVLDTRGSIHGRGNESFVSTLAVRTPSPGRRIAPAAESSLQLEAATAAVLHGSILWVADQDRLHGFHRQSGQHLRSFELARHGAILLHALSVLPESGHLLLGDLRSGALLRLDPGTGRVTSIARSLGSIWDLELLGESLFLATTDLGGEDTRLLLLEEGKDPRPVQTIPGVRRPSLASWRSGFLLLDGSGDSISWIDPGNWAVHPMAGGFSHPCLALSLPANRGLLVLESGSGDGCWLEEDVGGSSAP